MGNKRIGQIGYHHLYFNAKLIMNSIKYIVMGVRKILHVDLDAFFCSVEELLDPNLVGKPFAVGGQPGKRGVVASCSYAARQFGVRSAMPTGQALKLCPDLKIVWGRHGEYGKRSRQVMEILNHYSGLVEEVSIDEAFLDLSDLPQSGYELAHEIQSAIRRDTQLPCSIGVATNKLVAKVATDYGKGKHKGTTPPCAITVVEPGKEAEFLAPLPVRAMWGVGPKMEDELKKMGILTIGELATKTEAFLFQHFGKWGGELARHARGISESSVSTEQETKSVSNETTFEQDVADQKILYKTIKDLAAQVGYRLRKHGFCGSTVRIKLRWSDFTTITRQCSVKQPMDQDGVIYENAKTLFDAAWPTGKPVRLVGVGCSNLSDNAHQLSLWDTPNEKERRLLGAVDEIRLKYGKDALKKASAIKEKKKEN
jgi:DNA polymerase-4